MDIEDDEVVGQGHLAGWDDSAAMEGIAGVDGGPQFFEEGGGDGWWIDFGIRMRGGEDDVGGIDEDGEG